MKTQMPFNNEIEKTKKEIEVLTAKLSFLEELENHKTPCEIAFKDWWGQYPETGTWDGFDEKRWQGFHAGYEYAYQEKIMEKVQEEPMEKLGFVKNSDGSWTAQPLVETTQERGERVHNEMEETIKIHDGYGVVDYQPTPQTPEQVADGLKEAFKEAVKQGVVSSTKSPTLYDVIADWWDDTFTKKETSLQELVDAIEQWLPKEQSAEGSQNAYVECTVEGFNDCLQQIKSKLR